MPLIRFNGNAFVLDTDETVLDGLNRQGMRIPSSCRSGACQSCLMQAVEGMPPASAQNGLKDTLKAQGYFLACQCKATADMHVALPGADAVRRVWTVVEEKTPLNTDIMRFRLRPEGAFTFEAGQFVNVCRQDGLTRSYSVASMPGEGVLELHVRRLPNGVMSGWLHDNVQPGDRLEIAGPSGACFYTEGRPEQGLLLIGTGSGLAPLYGILRDALERGHSGPIRLFHGSYRPEGLYLERELRLLETIHPHFIYVPNADEGAGCAVLPGRADANAFASLPDLKGWRVFLCGHPDMVKAARRKAFLSGASMQDIYADSFCLSSASA